MRFDHWLEDDVDTDKKITRLEKELAESREQNKALTKKLEGAEFWNNWVYPQGATAEEIQNELADYKMIMSNVSVVYDHITCGLLSKCNYEASVVISEADNYQEKLIKQEIEEAFQSDERIKQMARMALSTEDDACQLEEMTPETKLLAEAILKDGE